MGRIRCGGYEDLGILAIPPHPTLSRQGRGSYKTWDGTATNASTSPIPSLPFDFASFDKLRTGRAGKGGE